MSNLQVFEYQGTKIQKRADGFVNLTQMCQVSGKRVDNWIRLKQTQEYIEVLSQSLTSEVLESERGGTNPATWGHPSLAINLARWISPKFAVWCDAHIFNLMVSGQTSIDINPIEEMKLKIELAKLEATKVKTELAILDKRQYITTALPEPVQQKILGYTTVKEVEYRDRIVKDDEVLNAGDTINKTALCYRYGLLTRNGKPDYKKLNACLDNLKLPSEAWKLTAQIRENQELNRDYLEYLDRQLMGNDRQLWIGE